jgi:iron complex transport system substrate-binding protein
MLEPDLFVVPDYVFDYVENLYEQLSQFAPVVAVADHPDWRDEYRFVGSIFGKEALADELIANLADAVTTTALELALEEQTVTVATIYPGEPSITLWLTTGIAQTDVLVQLGLTLAPDAAGFTVDDIGRAQLSVEQVNELTGETLIMLQTTTSDEEQTTFDLVTGDPLWQTIPAVQNERVFILERIGYPGEVRGRLALLADYRTIFGKA